jgi:O-antigen/teichoic acid export membrane protein
MWLPQRLARHSEFIGHVATLMSGKAAAGLIALVTMPVVARLFAPADFGVAALFVSVMAMIANVATLKYEMAIVLPKDDQEALTIMSFTYRLVLFVSLLLLLSLAIVETAGISIAALTLLGASKWLLPIGVLLTASIVIQEDWLTRTRSFKVSSASLVVGNATTGVSRIGIGTLLGSSSGGLIAGHFIGMMARLVVQRSASREGLRAMVGIGSWPEMKQVAARYLDFPKYNAPASFLFTLGQRLPVILFGVMFSPAIAGFYAMAYQLVKAPVTMVANSTRRVFRQKAASIKNQNRSLQKAFLLTSGWLALIGFPALVVLWAFGQPLGTWFLGGEWSVAGQYLEIIAPWLFMIWVMAPCNPVYVVLREQKLWLVLQATLTFLRLGIFGLAYMLSAGPEWTLHAYVLATVAGNFATWVTALLLIRKDASRPSGPGNDDGKRASHARSDPAPTPDPVHGMEMAA